MKSKGLERLLRLLLVLLGIGIGLAIAQLGLQWYRLSNTDPGVLRWLPVAAYTGMGVLGGLVFLLLSGRILRRFTQLSGAATMTLSAILYATLGALGYNIGKRRSREFTAMVTRLSGVREKRKTVRRGYASRKFLDTSAIVDGRIVPLLRTGVLEGEIVLAQYVIDEIQTLADSSDPQTREKGKRGLEMLRILQDESLATVDDGDDDSTRDVDVKLMRAARDCGGTVITTDTTLQKAAAVSGVKTVNLHALADALRPAVTEGMVLTLRLTKEGKESGQGIGHLPDGTLVVVENGKEAIGQEAEVTVTAVRQSPSGRMLFARM